jgi:DNA (cytosine-5)-methyltransferase 1
VDELSLKQIERILTPRRRKYVKVKEPPINPNSPRLLDLFCGAGGASMGYYLAGFTPVGVDLHPQPNYPFEFHQADALTYDYTGFDLIHASPPCPLFSSATPESHKHLHQDLITPIRPLLQRTGAPYIIENVPGSPLRNPITLCGSSFGLNIRRHRLFESNLPLYPLPCVHAWQLPHFDQRNRPMKVHLIGGSGPANAQAIWGKAMDIDWMTRYEVKDAVPPAYTRYLGAQALAYILHHRHYTHTMEEVL